MFYYAPSRKLTTISILKSLRSFADAHDVSYLEMHGSGTQAGDVIGMQSVSNTFAPIRRQRCPDQPLYLAIKANIGHGRLRLESGSRLFSRREKMTIPRIVASKRYEQQLSQRSTGAKRQHRSQKELPEEPCRKYH